MPTNTNNLVLLVNGHASAQVKAGQHNVFKARPGEHYRITAHQDAHEPVLDDVIAKKVGNHLQLDYAGGTQITLENYYLECKGIAACDVTLPSRHGGDFTLGADYSIDQGADPSVVASKSIALGDGSSLVYAHGEHATLMGLAQQNAVPAALLASFLPGSEAGAESGAGVFSASAAAPASGASADSGGDAFGHGFGNMDGIGGLALAGAGLALLAVSAGGGAVASSLTAPALASNLTIPASAIANAAANAAAAPVAAGAGATSGTDTIVAGTILAGPVMAGNDLTVKVYAADGATLLGANKVSDSGGFSVDVGSYAGAVIAEVSNGGGASDYFDESTGLARDLNGNLMAMVAVNGGVAFLNLNVLTTLAAMKAGAVFGAAASAAISADSATQANAAVASAFGLVNLTDGAITSTINATGGANLAYTPGNLSNAIKYGAVLAALSGVDALNSSNTQTSIHAMLGDLTLTGGTGVLSAAGHTLLEAGAAQAAPHTAGSLTSLIGSVLPNAPITLASEVSSATDAGVTLTGASLGQTLAGGAGDDILTGLGGADVLLGGAGNDTLVINQSDVTALGSPLSLGGNTSQLARVDGGSGFDTLRLAGANLTLNLSTIGASGARVTSIERIDLTGSGNGANTLKLSLNDVLDITDVNNINSTTQAALGFSNGSFTFGASVARHQLLVSGDASDSVTSSGWGAAVGTVTDASGHSYDVYNQGASAQLLIEHTITRSVL